MFSLYHSLLSSLLKGGSQLKLMLLIHQIDQSIKLIVVKGINHWIVD